MQENKKAHPLDGKRIGVFGKGGAGKSTITYLLAQVLQKSGYIVCVLDADSTNLGLHRVFEIAQQPKPLMEYFGGTIFTGGFVTCPVDDPTPLDKAEMNLKTLDQDFYACSPEGILFFVAGKIGDQGPGAGCDGPVAKIARDFRIVVEGHSPVTLIDFKAGLEDITRGVITSVDLAIFVIDPTLASVEMAANIKDIVKRVKAHHLPATAHLDKPELIELANRFFLDAKILGVWFILNKIHDKEEEDYLKQSLKEKGIEPISTIGQFPSILHAWLRGTPIEAENALRDIQKIVIELESAANPAGNQAEKK